MIRLVELMEVAVRDHDWLRVRAVLAEMKAVVQVEPKRPAKKDAA